MSAIALYLLSGFLGAGKTTLLQQLVQQFPRHRLGVLVNEFGGLGLDGLPFRAHGDLRLVEISGGSIFCACLKDGFVRTLKAFSEQPIDALLIENSGMADPSAMPRLLDGLQPYLKQPFDYRGNICLVDGTTFFDYVDVLEPVRRQVATANAIIVNKIDLLDPDERSELHQTLRAINPDAPQMDTIYAQVPMAFLDSALPGSRGAGSGSNTPHNRLPVFSLQAAGHCTEVQLTELHRLLAGHLIRMKGFANTENGWLDVQAVGSRLTMEPAAEDALEVLPTDGIRLVVIGKPDADLNEQTLRMHWNQIFSAEVRIHV